MGLAERADVIVDFRGLPDGTIITMTNTAPDAPFGGFPDVAADPSTTGQVMQFVVNSAHLGASPTDEIRCDNVNVACPLDRKGKRGKPIMNAVVNPATAASNVQDLMVSSAALENFTVANINAVPRELALIEEESAQICVVIDGVTGAISQVTGDPAVGCPVGSAPMAPKAAVLGTVDGAGAFTPQMWADPLKTNVATGDSEQWNLWNFTVDGHPIHVHLVKYKVLGRTMIGGGASQGVTAAGGVEPWEDGWKDTVIAYPGEITSIAATFDIPGLYVWHCHIVEHEDNEMMVPMCVGVEGIDCPANVFDGDGRIPRI
jgi:FtsP/CotA-like multicopper oxidase with cupredoxin domain